MERIKLYANAVSNTKINSRYCKKYSLIGLKSLFILPYFLVEKTLLNMTPKLQSKKRKKMTNRLLIKIYGKICYKRHYNVVLIYQEHLKNT